jgi:hypothetical protein
MRVLRALIPALAACGLAAATDAPAQPLNGATRAAPVSGAGSMTRTWSGTHRSGTWSGGHWSGGHHWVGHPRHRWHGGVSFYFGVPLFWPAYYWGWPYYYYDYPRTVIYREVERIPEGEIAPSTEVQPAPGAPAQGPLYMNYCESAKAYYPKVTSCPEGWKFVEPTR